MLSQNEDMIYNWLLSMSFKNDLEFEIIIILVYINQMVHWYNIFVSNDHKNWYTITNPLYFYASRFIGKKDIQNL